MKEVESAEQGVVILRSSYFSNSRSTLHFLPTAYCRSTVVFNPDKKSRDCLTAIFHHASI